jgi:hypothetical protein
MVNRRYTLSSNDVRMDRTCSKYDKRQRTNDPSRLRTAEGIEALFLGVEGFAHMTRRASSKAARKLHASYKQWVRKMLLA